MAFFRDLLTFNSPLSSDGIIGANEASPDITKWSAEARQLQYDIYHELGHCIDNLI